MVDSIFVANSIIYLSKRDNIYITSVKLQILMYYIYKMYLIKTNKKLFNESFLKGKYCPIQSGIEYAFKNFGKEPVDYIEFSGMDFIRILDFSKENEWVIIITKSVWESLKDYDDDILINVLQSSYAWRRTKEIGDIIDDDFIINEQNPYDYNDNKNLRVA